jgi:hypothetical protein
MAGRDIRDLLALGWGLSRRERLAVGLARDDEATISVARLTLWDTVGGLEGYPAYPSRCCFVKSQ